MPDEKALDIDQLSIEVAKLDDFPDEMFLLADALYAATFEQIESERNKLINFVRARIERVSEMKLAKVSQ